MNIYQDKKTGTSWEYGYVDDIPARRHIKKANVQFVLWKRGDQKYVDGVGHMEDKWHDFDKSWWPKFVPDNT